MIQRLHGPYNATSPAGHFSMGQVLHTCRDVSGSEATFTWVSDEFLMANEVRAYVQLPLWVPAEYTGFDTCNTDKAAAAGLAIRPLAETVHDTLTWEATRPTDYTWRGGLTPEREAELLQKWHKRE